MTGGVWDLPPLTPADRCDRGECNAAALVRVVSLAGDLYFCKHHFEQDETVLRIQARYIHDERHTLTDGIEAFIKPAEMEPLGRMLTQTGLRSADCCRWCTQRLIHKRVICNGRLRSFYVCEVCDNSEADMTDWRAAVTN